MPVARLNAVSERRARGAETVRNQHEAFDSLHHMRLLKAARNLAIQWRRNQDGTFTVPPGATLAFLQAVDESWDALKGVME